jgi:HSP20 family protein
MAMIRYRTHPSTLSPFDTANRLARLLDDGLLSGSRDDMAIQIPDVDVEETTDAIILTADLPGFDPDQVEISVENQVLTLSGTRERVRELPDATTEEAETRDGPQASRMHMRERRWGSFTRSFTLPRTIRAEEISASFDRGVLTVHMPKSAEARSRKIEIRTGA